MTRWKDDVLTSSRATELADVKNSFVLFLTTFLVFKHCLPSRTQMTLSFVSVAGKLIKVLDFALWVYYMYVINIIIYSLYINNDFLKKCHFLPFPFKPAFFSSVFFNFSSSQCAATLPSPIRSLSVHVPSDLYDFCPSLSKTQG